MQPSAKFAFFGTPSVASETLAYLLTHGYTPTIVITAPDAPRGRGLTLTPSPTNVLAQSHGLPVLSPKILDTEARNAIMTYRCEYAIVVAYGKIFPEALIESFPKGVVNVHYSLLPKYRGASPLETALLHGETETGVTLQKMAKELDAGDIIAKETAPIAPHETARELRPRLVALGARLLTTTLPDYLNGKLAPSPQDPTQATRAYKLGKGDGQLSLEASAQENWNKYRAYADSIGTYFFKDGQRIKITEAEYVQGIFRILRVIPEGKREISFADFSRHP